MIRLMVVLLMAFLHLWCVGVSSLGRWSYHKESVWDLRTKLCRVVLGKCNVSRVAF